MTTEKEAAPIGRPGEAREAGGRVFSHAFFYSVCRKNFSVGLTVLPGPRPAVIPAHAPVPAAGRFEAEQIYEKRSKSPKQGMRF
jgi:hypothetical protein